MANMQMNKTPMPEQDPQVRNHNFLEVAQGYTLEQAMNEAQRCIHCKNPACVSGCPVGIPIPEFVSKVAEGDLEGAYELLSNANALPAISGRVCPQENQCEGKCVRGVKGEPVAIGRVERFVADWAAERGIPAQLSMEQRMGCGYGTCVLCTIDTVDGRLKVCSDGPVFTREQLGWGK